MAITAKDLISKKKIIEENKLEKITMEVKRLGGDFEFRIPDTYDITDSSSYSDGHGGQGGEAFLIQACCLSPSFKDKALLDAYEASEPVDVVNAIFFPGEIQEIAKRLLKVAGYDDDVVGSVEKVKN